MFGEGAEDTKLNSELCVLSAFEGKIVTQSFTEESQSYTELLFLCVTL